MNSVSDSIHSFFIKKRNLFPVIILTVSVLIYCNTLFNRYALDDSIVITDNIFVKKGFAGIKDIFTTETFTGFFKQKKELVQGGRYRPLSVATFALEYELWGLKPGISHTINIFLYSLLCLLLFKTVQQVLIFLGIEQKSRGIAFLATLIYSVHPVHTEVVANLKGRDELLTVLFFLWSLLLFLQYLEKPLLKKAILSGLFLFIALLSKENALALIPVILLLFVIKYSKVSFKKFSLGFLILSAASLIYMIIRFKIAGGFSAPETNELMNNPYLLASTQQKTATIMYTQLIYFKLLFFPHPLTYDYYPYHITLHNWSDPWVLLSLTLHFPIVFYGIIKMKSKPVLSFGILFYFITLLPVSNLIVNIGSFMNERFLFLPSIGFTLLLGAFFYHLLIHSHKKWSLGFIVCIYMALITSFSVKTIVRNTQWKDNYTLFTHDVMVSKNSAKGNCTAGGALLEKAQEITDPNEREKLLIRSIKHLNHSISIYPNYVDALLLLGNAHFELDKNLPEVLKYYKKLLMLAPGHDVALNNLKKMLALSDNADYRKSGYIYLLTWLPEDFDVNYQLGVTYGKMLNQLDSSRLFLKRALKVRPDSKTVNRDLGVAFAMSSQYLESLSYFEKALQLDPEDPENYINLGITYQNLGRLHEAKAMFEKAEAIKK